MAEWNNPLLMRIVCTPTPTVWYQLAAAPLQAAGVCLTGSSNTFAFAYKLFFDAGVHSLAGPDQLEHLGCHQGEAKQVGRGGHVLVHACMHV